MQVPSIEINFSQSNVTAHVGNSSARKSKWRKFSKGILANLLDAVSIRTIREEGDRKHNFVNNEELLFFLQHGRFQSDLSYDTASGKVHDIHLDHRFLDRLAVVLAQSDEALKRLLNSFSADFKQQITTAICDQVDPEVGKLIALLTRMKGHGRRCPDDTVIQAYVLYRSEEEIPDNSFAFVTTVLFWSMADEISRYKLTTALLKFIKRDRCGAALFAKDTQWQHAIRSFAQQAASAKAGKLQRAINQLSGKSATKGR